MARYAAPWEPALRGTTRAALVLVVGGCAMLVALAAARRGPGAALWAAPIVAAALGGALWLAWLLAPISFTVDHVAVRVERRLGSVVVPLASIRDVFLHEGPLPQPARWTGSGGVFGYYGSCRSRALGAFQMFATRRDRLVVVDTNAGRFVLSPEPPQEFVEELRAHLPCARPGDAPPLQPGSAT